MNETAQRIFDEYRKDDVLSFDDVVRNLNLPFSSATARRRLVSELSASQKQEYKILIEKKRLVFNQKDQSQKNNHVECGICGKQFKNNLGGSVTSHLKSHGIADKQTHQFIKSINVLTDSSGKLRQLTQDPTHSCKICGKNFWDRGNKSGQITHHIKKDHGLDIFQYVERYPDESFLFERKIRMRIKLNSDMKNPKMSFKCELCGQVVKRITQKHLDRVHAPMKLAEYKRMFKKTISDNLSKIFAENIREFNHQNQMLFSSKSEDGFAQILEDNNVTYSRQHKIIDTNFGTKYFDFLIGNVLVEIDGTYWHGKNVSNNYTMDQMINLSNDIIKEKIAIQNGFSIVHIWDDEIDRIDVSKISGHTLNTKIKLFDSIIKRPYNYQKADQCSFAICYFLQECYPNIVDETDQEVFDISKIRLDARISVDSNGIYIPHNRSEDLKYTYQFFPEFYKTRMIGSRTIQENYSDSDVLFNVVSHMYANGMSISRFSTIKNIKWFRKTGVSLFSHSFMYALLKYAEMLLGHVPSVVYDPFSGWGNRLVGFHFYNKQHEQTKLISNDLNSSICESNKKLNQFLVTNTEFYNKNSIEWCPDADVLISCPPYYDFENFNVGNFDEESLIEFVHRTSNIPIRILVVDGRILSSLQKYGLVLSAIPFSKSPNNVEYVIRLF